MNIVFVSNYFNHHQKPFSDEMFRLIGEGYHFIVTKKMEEERLQLGWGEITIPDYVVDYNVKAAYCQRLINSADVVIIGSAPEHLLNTRKKDGKLIFRYQERIHKVQKDYYLKYFMRLLKYQFRNRGKKIYLLCASAFTAPDYRKYFLFKNKAYRWGYFPKTYHYNVDSLMDRKEKNTILWVARLINWKHPEAAVYVANRLREDNLDFKMRLIGTGNMSDDIQNQVNQLGLKDYVCLTGSMSPDVVRHEMEQAGILIFTSDENEGWGAVLNEAMNSGCAVVASDMIGAAPYLVQDGQNGLLFQSKNWEELYNKVKKLIDEPKEQVRLGTAAYHTIVDEWNAEIAAKRLINLIEHVEENARLFVDGPCSKAD